MKFPEPKKISFRNEIPEIINTGYFTHSLYYHPAKFIPQIVRYCIKKYCSGKNKNILDPFAGSGTTGLEALVLGCNAYLIDINPLLQYFYPIKLPSLTRQEFSKDYLKALEYAKSLFNKKGKINLINEKELEYWYNEEIFNIVSNLWINFHRLPKNNPIAKAIIALALFKISKLYSYAEHSMPKLFTSKRKKEIINNVVRNNNISKQVKKDLYKEITNIGKTVNKLLTYKKFDNKIKYWSGVDSYLFNYKSLPKLDCIITSPPYLQAQEYIRTFKMEMMWLNFSKEEIRNFMQLEIPYRKNEGVIKGSYIDNVRAKINNKNLLKLFDSYFWFVIKALEFSTQKLKKGGYICILIGNPKMNGVEVEIWKVIYEYFVKELKFKSIDILEDSIKVRKLFSGRKNSNPSGMKSEYLIVLEK